MKNWVLCLGVILGSTTALAMDNGGYESEPYNEAANIRETLQICRSPGHSIREGRCLTIRQNCDNYKAGLGGSSAWCRAAQLVNWNDIKYKEPQRQACALNSCYEWIPSSKLCGKYTVVNGWPSNLITSVPKYNCEYKSYPCSECNGN